MPKKGYIQTKEHRLKNIKFGKDNPNYKGFHAITNIIYYCKDCNKKIAFETALYGKNRCHSCSKKGKRNPSYIDGRTKYSYPSFFSFKLKEKIRFRDKYTCQLCGLNQNDYFQKLSIHHIDYNKYNCKELNLITLCKSCNTKVNNDRIYNIELFKYMFYYLTYLSDYNFLT